jgi:hypothetical protein
MNSASRGTTPVAHLDAAQLVVVDREPLDPPATTPMERATSSDRSAG